MRAPHGSPQGDHKPTLPKPLAEFNRTPSAPDQGTGETPTRTNSEDLRLPLGHQVPTGTWRNPNPQPQSPKRNTHHHRGTSSRPSSQNPQRPQKEPRHPSNPPTLQATYPWQVPKALRQTLPNMA